MTWHAWWGAAQWAAYLEHMDLPVKGASKLALQGLEAEGADHLAPRDYAALLLEDPLLALRLLKEANNRLPRRLGRDITTPLGVVLALGTEIFRQQLQSAPEVPPDNAGFPASEGQATLAARVALAWGGLHHDLDPGELALAALLANAGEIELWAFAPELPQKALAALKSGQASRSSEAQQQACGFAFKDVTLRLIEDWNLPILIRQLVRGDETIRARLARLAVDAARHLGNGPDDPALPHDVLLAMKLTNASLKTVVEAMPRLTAEHQQCLLHAAEALAAGQDASSTKNTGP
jgi:HD-like signal output (HDOD) protein